MIQDKLPIKSFIIRVCLVFLFCSSEAFASPSRSLTIFTEPNFSVPLTKIARLYSQKYNVTVSVEFNSAADLFSEVDSGEPADVFICAHPQVIENIKQKGLADVYNVGYIAQDSLALVSYATNPNITSQLLEKEISIESALKVLNENKSTLILDSEGSSSGSFANEFLKNLSLPDVKLFPKLPEDKTPILSLINNGQDSYGLLLLSQVKNAKDFKVIAVKKDNKIFYQAFVIAGDNMETAREFLKFLKTEVAKEALQSSGFKIENK